MFSGTVVFVAEASLIFIHFSLNLPARQALLLLSVLSQTSFFLFAIQYHFKSCIWGLLPDFFASNWSCWFLGFSTSPQPFWILICPWIVLTSVRHRWLFFLFSFFLCSSTYFSFAHRWWYCQATVEPCLNWQLSLSKLLVNYSWSRAITQPGDFLSNVFFWDL